LDILKTRCRRGAVLATMFALFAPTTLGQSKARVVHAFVALADNQHQGIIPAPANLGNGDDPQHNLYWGAAFGVKTFFNKAPEWREIASVLGPKSSILERIIFEDRTKSVFLVADAYRGSEIKQAPADFFNAAAGLQETGPLYSSAKGSVNYEISSDSDVVVYVEPDGLMDFPLTLDFAKRSPSNRAAIILACASKSFFSDLLRTSGAQPLLWTTGLMAPEAYALKAALDGWMLNQNIEQIRHRAAAAYAEYQKCSLTAALRLFPTLGDSSAVSPEFPYVRIRESKCCGASTSSSASSA
jgi:hypothetical protein